MFFFLLIIIASAQTTQLSHVMRKPDFCLCANKGTDQLCSNCTADQISCAVTAQLICAFVFATCFCYMDSTIPLLFYLYPKFQDSNFFFCDCTGRFMLDLVRRPVFSRRGSNTTGTNNIFLLWRMRLKCQNYKTFL